MIVTHLFLQRSASYSEVNYNGYSEFEQPLRTRLQHYLLF